ncbi:hypothetical protein EYC80_009029 [Monilinia laxa]|uniref:Uncharacterized protein n=1 Tax=Monilinia laxa TaxID=61186 RepID=A0A5N6K299_MONLA|nr:hypothetical protein EYC80_009029 [Monilinia laxa]
MSNQNQTTSWDSSLTLTEDTGEPPSNREAANNRLLGLGTPPEHPTPWEQRHAIIFDVGRRRLYTINRSEIDMRYRRISLNRLRMFEADSINISIQHSATSGPEYLARFNVDSLGLREKRLTGEIMECWVLDERNRELREKRSIWRLIAWRCRALF